MKKTCVHLKSVFCSCVILTAMQMCLLQSAEKAQMFPCTAANTKGDCSFSWAAAMQKQESSTPIRGCCNLDFQPFRFYSLHKVIQSARNIYLLLDTKQSRHYSKMSLIVLLLPAALKVVRKYFFLSNFIKRTTINCHVNKLQMSQNNLPKKIYDFFLAKLA